MIRTVITKLSTAVRPRPGSGRRRRRVSGLGLDDLAPEGVEEGEHLALLAVTDAEVRQHRPRVAEEHLPVAGRDAHTGVGGPHVAAGVEGGAARRRDEVVDDQLAGAAAVVEARS